jgi:hypothetical protein
MRPILRAFQTPLLYEGFSVKSVLTPFFPASSWNEILPLTKAFIPKRKNSKNAISDS